jgi:carboxymethylenebutenolidase
MSESRETYNEDITRRHFLEGAATAVIGAAALSSPDAAAQPERKALDDPTVVHQKVTFPSGRDTIDGYVAHPKAAGRYPVVLIIPGIFGVSEYMRESVAELAQSGFAALALNLFSRTPEAAKIDDFRQLMSQIVDKIPDRQFLQDIQAGIDYLKRQPYAREGGVGVVGFCMGGKYALLIAAHSSDVRAAVPFYGPLIQRGSSELRPAAPLDLVKRIKAPVQGHYGAADQGIPIADVKRFEETLKALGTPVEFFVYERAGHAFHDYSRPTYNAQAARQAWGRAIEFLKANLK